VPEGTLTFKRGQLRWVNLEPGKGAEVRKIRSCLIVQNDAGNQHGLLTIVVPTLPGHKRAPYVVNLCPSEENGLEQPRCLDLGQIRSVDLSRVLGLVGTLEDDYWPRIRAGLNVVLGFP